jgi:hypothetical protein
LIAVKDSHCAFATMGFDAPSGPPVQGGNAEPMQVHAYLACAPRQGGVRAALFYAAWGQNICGWLAGERAERGSAAYFALERDYSARDAIYRRSVDDDVRGRWIEQAVPVTTEIRCPIPEADCDELSRRQSVFVREWLFYPDDPLAQDEVEGYRKLGLPVRDVNVRAAQFHRFDQRRPVWVHASPGIDFNLVLYLKKRLPLDRRGLRVRA